MLLTITVLVKQGKSLLELGDLLICQLRSFCHGISNRITIPKGSVGQPLSNGNPSRSSGGFGAYLRLDPFSVSCLGMILPQWHAFFVDP